MALIWVSTFPGNSRRRCAPPLNRQVAMRMPRRARVRLLAILCGVPLLVVATFLVCPLLNVDESMEIDRVRFGAIPGISDALGAYRYTVGRYPTEAEGLGALLNPTSVGGPYLRRPPTDPWGNAYVYRLSPQGDTFSLYSRGRNGVDEEGGGDDVVNGMKAYTCEEYHVGCHRACKATQIAAVVGLLLWIAGLGLSTVVLVARWCWRQVNRVPA
jgi:general secretion pathway protein G